MFKSLNCVQCKNEFNTRYQQKFCSKECFAVSKILTKEQIYNRIKNVYESNVIIKDNCWGWKGEINQQGYGRISYGSQRITIHRAAWLIFHKEIPKGMCILHKCDNPLCSNLDHLFLGTIKDNVHDMIKKGRRIIKKSPHGHRSILNLTDNEIIEIKQLLLSGILQKDIAIKFNISRVSIHRLNKKLI